MNEKSFVAFVDAEDAEGILMRFADHQSGVLVCMRGMMSFTIGTRQYDICRGDMVIKLPFINLSFLRPSQDFQGMVCIVDLEFVFSAIAPVNLGANMQFALLHPVSHPSERNMKALISLMTLIEERNADERPLSGMITSSLTHAMAYLVLDSYINASQSATRSSNAGESIMMRFQSDLTRDFKRHRMVAHYAELQNLSPRYFSTTIKAVSGYTPLYWINTAVVAEAKRLMRDSKKSIKEIAYALNFASPTFFSRWYRTCTGDTPSRYRTLCRITIVQKDPGNI